MAFVGSLQFSPGVGLCWNQEGCGKRYKSILGRSRPYLLSSRLSSCGSQQDSWILHLSNSVNRPIHLLPFRCNVIKSHSFVVLGQNVTIPGMKTASAALTRSCNLLQSTPVVVKFVPAIGIILFAVWGLGPLMRKARNLFLHQGDSSWKKSTAHYVMTSYLQPILLWTGATLICRALDPVVMPSEASQLVKQRLLTFLKSLSTVLAFAYCLSGVIQQAQRYFMETSDPADTRNMGFQFAGKAIYTAVWVAAVSLFMELLGFSTQKWLTAGGLGTVLLTLAGREIFTNFLSSVMIHATRPFIINEWIQTKIEGYEVSGTVEHVGWWSPTVIRGEDREAVHIPNHKFTMNVVRNLSQKTHWRIKTHLAISHLDVNKINNIVADMRKVLAKNPQVEQQKLHRRVFLDNINPENQALLILVSCFVKTSHFEEYLCVKEAIMLDLLRVISHHRARLATPIRTIQKVYADADLEGGPFAESIFSRGAASHRPLLLIEPPYKINGEDKTKTQPRSVRSSGDQDKQASGQPISDPKADAKVKEPPKSESKPKETLKSGSIPNADAENSNFEKEEKRVATSSTSELKVDGKATVKSPAKPAPEKVNKVADVLSSDLKSSGSAADDSRKSNPDNSQSSGKTGSPVPSSENRDEKPDGSLSNSQAKQPLVSQLPKSRPALEENIVLGVALEGSKRTLPIEEGLASASASATAPAEVKGVGGSRNGNGTPAAENDEKDG